MTASGKVLLALCGCVLASSVVARQSAAQRQSATAAARATSAPDLATKAMVENACSGCHDFTRVSMQHKSAGQWEAIVDQMISMGAPLSDAEAPRVAAYLAKRYGPAASGKPASRPKR